jgi:hypothetical protein
MAQVKTWVPVAGWNRGFNLGNRFIVAKKKGQTEV